LEVDGGQDTENRNIVVKDKTGGSSQQWEVKYEDELEKEPTKGELNKEYGLYVERDFHIVSQLSSGRYIDLISNNMVLKTQNGRNTQAFFFDQKTKTIKSRSSTSYSIDIESSGNGKNMRITTTSSRWW
jgi:hypothetical protein